MKGWSFPMTQVSTKAAANPSATRRAGPKRSLLSTKSEPNFRAARIMAGLPVAYFDGPGGTQVPRAVVDAMADYLYHHNANTHWNYPTSARNRRDAGASSRGAGRFRGGAPDEIVFGANATTLAFHVSRTLAGNWRQAMRSSSPSSTTMPTSGRGKRWRGAGLPAARCADGHRQPASSIGMTSNER